MSNFCTHILHRYLVVAKHFQLLLARSLVPSTIIDSMVRGGSPCLILLIPLCVNSKSLNAINNSTESALLLIDTTDGIAIEKKEANTVLKSLESRSRLFSAFKNARHRFEELSELGRAPSTVDSCYNYFIH